jgi:hypothetical protein
MLFHLRDWGRIGMVVEMQALPFHEALAALVDESCPLKGVCVTKMADTAMLLIDRAISKKELDMLKRWYADEVSPRLNHDVSVYVLS